MNKYIIYFKAYHPHPTDPYGQNEERAIYMADKAEDAIQKLIAKIGSVNIIDWAQMPDGNGHSALVD